MRRIILSGLAAGLLLLTKPSVADEARYISPSGAFSIATSDFAERRFQAGAENANGDIVVVDFPATNTMGLPQTWRRSVEWIKLDKPIEPAQYDAQATDAVTGYLEGRFGGKLALTGRGKFRDADGRLVYAFAAAGTFNQLSAQWQGAVLFFDHGVALVSEVMAAPASPSQPQNGVVNQALVDWAETLRPGR
jgi:hypothetical protein